MTKKHLLSCAIAVAALYAYSFPVSALPKCPEGVWHNCTASWTYDNGNVYEGDWINVKGTGKGTYTYANGNVYEGDFIDGKRTGRGTYTYANGKIEDGIFANNIFMDTENMTAENKKEEMIDALREALKIKGTQSVIHMESSECPPNGVWDNCTGTWAFDSEISYSGEFKDGLPHGKGTLTWDNGDQYIGEFIYSKITGKGSYEWANGDHYFGYLNEGNKTGEGILTISK